MKITKLRLREIVKEELNMHQLQEVNEESLSVPKWVLVAALEAFEDAASASQGDGYEAAGLSPENQKAANALRSLLQQKQQDSGSKFNGLAFATERE